MRGESDDAELFSELREHRKSNADLRNQIEVMRVSRDTKTGTEMIPESSRRRAIAIQELQTESRIVSSEVPTARFCAQRGE
jgi:hypothetical protein